MVRCIRYFLDFCYLARRNVVDDSALELMEVRLKEFREARTIFEEVGVVKKMPVSIPRQHSMTHYVPNIRKFAAANGLCTSITESKHIKAVKEPWRRSNRFEALGQMLLTNLRLDKIAAARVDFAACGMLVGSCLTPCS